MVHVQPERLNFGKHKGELISRLSDGYLQWMLINLPDSSPWHKAAIEALRVKQEAQQDVCSVRDLLIDLKSCTRKRDLHWGIRLHAKAVETGNGSDMYVTTALIKMYAKCGSMRNARQVFDAIQKPDVVSWSALLLGYAENGEGNIGLELFSKMKTHGCVPNSVTYVAVLKACTSLAVSGDKASGLEMGRNLHSNIGPHLNMYVQSTLIDMYSKCSSMAEARQVFDSIQEPDVMAWTSLLLGYAENGDGRTALELSAKMKASGCAPNSLTYMAVLKACISLSDVNGKAYSLKTGRSIESKIGSSTDRYVQSTLIDLYAKCGSMVDARRVFDSIGKPDVKAWTSLLLGYVDNGEGRAALELFSRMKARGCEPDSVTYVVALKACTALKSMERRLEMARSIHLEVGCHLNIFVQNTLVDVYAKCGSMTDAAQVFDSIQKPTVVSWSALLLGYADNGDGQAVLDKFSVMKSRGFVPNSVTYMAVLKACISTGAFVLGRKIHSDVREFTPKLVTCLVDFYAKQGSVKEAHAVFDLHSAARELATWNALLSGYSTCGDTVSVFNLLKAMQDQSFRPNAVTLCTVLLCCSHAGLVEKAKEYFRAMPSYGITPSVMHYTCMVDAFGRANQLSEAIAVLRTMPCSPDAVIWMTLLAACRRWKNVAVGTWGFESLMDIDEENTAACALMEHWA